MLPELREMPLPDVFTMYWAAGQEIDRRGGSVDSYAAPHVWSLVAKQLRDMYPTGNWGDDEYVPGARSTIHALALAFAKRFDEDKGFDPVTWLDKCSPDPELYPFSELWEEE